MAAAGGGVPQLGGYHYEFVANVPDKLKCSICLSTLKDPMQVMKCGHRFCRLCIDPILSKPPASCPVDRQSISHDKVFEDAACEREVLDLHVKCPSDGCVWSGELRNVEGHEGICQFKLVDCKNADCKEKIMRSALRNHVTRNCKLRNIECVFCKGIYTWILSQEHKDKCEWYPLPCVNRCGKRDIPRNKMIAHIKDVCPAAVVPCKYEHVGCEVKIRRDALQDHIKESMEKHLDLACSKLRQLENTPCNHQLNSISFVWKIPDFGERLQEAKTGVTNSIYGEPFYSSPQGYKMRIQLFPDGCGDGKGSHLSVYIRIMKGEYDGVLTWPFLPKITFTLIDQQEKESERENKSSALKADSTLTANFKRPVEKENVGRGFPKFVCRDILHTRRYIVDNTIFLKVEVELPA